MRDKVDVAVVGAGAAGLAAAITGARRGASVVILERLPRAGKKLLATGGGRCNILNDSFSAADFSSTDPGLVSSVLDRCGPEEIRKFFEGLGLRLRSEESGRVYPATNQAASVLKVLDIEVGRLGIGLETRFEVEKIVAGRGLFEVRAADGRQVEARTVILAGGGRSYPALGSNGSCYELAVSFGHRIVTPVPSAVPLVIKDRLCHLLQGLRLRARVVALIGGRPGLAAEGELLFTAYGLSGTAVLDVSEGVSIALNREGRKDVAVSVDLIPDLAEAELAGAIAARLRSDWPERDLLAGLLPEKLALVLPQLLGEAGPAGAARDPSARAGRLAAALKAREYRVEGTRSWNEAEFTSGGVDAREVKPGTLESKRRPGLYLAGEVLDVQGGRGGYNLAWAWASGFVAGLESRPDRTGYIPG
jgi:predicted Rossmann fold flavoprotein